MMRDFGDEGFAIKAWMKNHRAAHPLFPSPGVGDSLPADCHLIVVPFAAQLFSFWPSQLAPINKEADR